MVDILKFKRPSPKAANKGTTLCKRGFHKWKVVKSTGFDSRQGKLVTQERCERCGKTRATGK